MAARQGSVRMTDAQWGTIKSFLMFLSICSAAGTWLLVLLAIWLTWKL